MRLTFKAPPPLLRVWLSRRIRSPPQPFPVTASHGKCHVAAIIGRASLSRLIGSSSEVK